MRHIIPPSEYYLKTKTCICTAHRRKKKPSVSKISSAAFKY